MEKIKEYDAKKPFANWLRVSGWKLNVSDWHLKNGLSFSFISSRPTLMSLLTRYVWSTRRGAVPYCIPKLTMMHQFYLEKRNAVFFLLVPQPAHMATLWNNELIEIDFSPQIRRIEVFRTQNNATGARLSRIKVKHIFKNKVWWTIVTRYFKANIN